MSAKVMEQWINDTLAEAAHLDIPAGAPKGESQKPMERY